MQKRAFAAYRQRGERLEAARLARWLAFLHGAVHGNMAVAKGVDGASRAAARAGGGVCGPWVARPRPRTLDGRPACAPLLDLLLDVLLARGDLDAAAETLDRLAELATNSANDRTAARAEFAAGRMLAAEGHERASSHLQTAVASFSALELPLEAACSQLELARAIAGRAPDPTGR